MSHGIWRDGPGACLRGLLIVLIAGLVVRPPLRAQGQDGLELLVVPFGGLPSVEGTGGIHQAIGAHLLWPAGAPTGLCARYELRWTSDNRFYDAGSIDLCHRVVGNDTAEVAVTGGWARWDRTDYGTAGLRARWPIIHLDEGGTAAVQAWFDLRYAMADFDEMLGLDGKVWGELMLAVVLSVRVGG